VRKQIQQLETQTIKKNKKKNTFSELKQQQLAKQTTENSIKPTQTTEDKQSDLMSIHSLNTLDKPQP
jgi:Tfp pilus assembly protein PilP